MHVSEGYSRLVLESSPDGLDPWDRKIIAHGDEARERCSEILGYVQAEQRDKRLYGMVLELMHVLDGELAEDPPVTAAPVTDAVNVIFRNRHHLAPDVLRSLQDIYLCASAARYGEPHETGWLEDAEFYTAHDIAGCEADNQPGEPDDDAPPFHDPLAPIADLPGDTPWPEARRILAERTGLPHP